MLLRLVGAMWILPSLLTYLHLWSQHLLVNFEPWYRDAVRIRFVNNATTATGLAQVPPAGMFVLRKSHRQAYETDNSTMVYSQLEQRHESSDIRSSGRTAVWVKDCLETATTLVKRMKPSSQQTLLLFRHRVDSPSRPTWCLEWNQAEWCRRYPSSTRASNRLDSSSDDDNEIMGEYYFYLNNAQDRQIPAIDTATARVVVERIYSDSSVGSFGASFWPGQSRSPFRKQSQIPNTTQQRQLTPLQQALTVHPATTVWVLINLSLAFVYWNQRVPVSSVGKLYSRMVSGPSFEIWRVLTGATAHFEAWHLGFNIMSLSALGQQLEGRTFTSLEFLFWNFSLILWTSTIWLGLQRIRRGEEAPTVGYSGVLFAWMVVAALEQQVSCPIPFMPDTCFQAFRIGSFQFNWGPLVQLVLMQVLLPRVSWTGHLAGIVAGFALHWGVLPKVALEPAVALPFLYYAYMRRIRFILSPDIRGYGSTTGWSNEDGDDEGSEREAAGKLLVLLPHGAALALSVLAFGPLSSLTLAYFGVFLFYKLRLDVKGPEQSKAATRGFIVSAVLVQVVDAMILGGWMVSIRLELWQRGALGNWREIFCACAIMFLRALALLSSTIAEAARICSHEPESGIFFYVLNYSVLRPAIEVASVFSRQGVGRLVPRPNSVGAHRASHSAREDGVSSVWVSAGPGHVLGGRATGRNASRLAAKQ